MSADSFTFQAIGRVRSPFTDKASAPRQPSEAREARGVVELCAGLEDAVDSLASFSHIWLVFVFHEAGARTALKVLPPRSGEKRGVFATRSPHRPNPIGLSVVRLLGVRGLALDVEGLDLIDGTPLLDVKPYLPYADALPDASSGWVAKPADPGPRWDVQWESRAQQQVRFLEEATGVELQKTVATLLATGPEPRAYRRIRRDGDGLRLAYKSWRFFFTIVGAEVRVARLGSGYRAAELQAGAGPEVAQGLDAHALHRRFVERFS